jgi:hypothetical protein
MMEHHYDDILDENYDDDVMHVDRNHARGGSFSYYTDHYYYDYNSNNVEDAGGWFGRWKWWLSTWFPQQHGYRQEEDFMVTLDHAAASGGNSKTQWGVVVALVLVCAVQFQFPSMLRAMGYKIRHEGPRATLVDLAFAVHDLLRGYLQIATEVVRSLRHPALWNLWWDGSNGNGRVLDDHASSTRRNIGFFSGGAMGQPPPPPPLVIVGPNGGLQEDRSNNGRRSPSPASSFSSHSSTEHAIEPAFLNEEDYPPGWLVYHVQLGVVPKEEADAYDAMIRRKLQEEQKLKEENEKQSAKVDQDESAIEAAEVPKESNPQRQSDSPAGETDPLEEPMDQPSGADTALPT